MSGKRVDVAPFFVMKDPLPVSAEWKSVKVFREEGGANYEVRQFADSSLYVLFSGGLPVSDLFFIPGRRVAPSRWKMSFEDKDMDGDTDIALKVGRRTYMFLNKGSELQSAMELGAKYFAEGKCEDAKGEFQKAKEINPKNPVLADWMRKMPTCTPSPAPVPTGEPPAPAPVSTPDSGGETQK